LSCDRFDFYDVSRNLQPLGGDCREEAFEPSRGQKGDPSCTLNDDECVLNASGNVEYATGSPLGSFPATPETQPTLKNDEDFVGSGMAVARRPIASNSMGC
jgi:hypothetical protein